MRLLRARPQPRAGELEISKYPFQINHHLAEGRGKLIFQQRCATCHGWNGQQVGKVVPIAEIRTDPYRLDSYTFELAVNQNTLGAGHWWRFRNFRKTAGYANMPLDGLWARAPYLHNGSVPTLRDLLKKSEDRPRRFYRGDDAYDFQNVGFSSPIPTDDLPQPTMRLESGRILVLLDTRSPGNGNTGHEYGTDLVDEDKAALLEYLKTL